MKNRLLLLVIFLLMSCFDNTAKAQDVYNIVLESATRIVNSPTSSFTQTQIAQFKHTALIYMKKKAFEETDSVPSAFLDTQAYYLSEFITFFFDEIIKSKKMSEDKRKEKIMLFMDASVSNPLFDDKDQETTMAFINDGGELTPFCLNTNWQKAYAAAKSQIKK